MVGVDTLSVVEPDGLFALGLISLPPSAQTFVSSIPKPMILHEKHQLQLGRDTDTNGKQECTSQVQRRQARLNLLDLSHSLVSQELDHGTFPDDRLLTLQAPAGAGWDITRQKSGDAAGHLESHGIAFSVAV
eukprot:1702305-Rhodomonas_salina.3